jgi:hypothetical protein
MFLLFHFYQSAVAELAVGMATQAAATAELAVVKSTMTASKVFLQGEAMSSLLALEAHHLPQAALVLQQAPLAKPLLQVGEVRAKTVTHQPMVAQVVAGPLEPIPLEGPLLT